MKEKPLPVGRSLSSMNYQEFLSSQIECVFCKGSFQTPVILEADTCGLTFPVSPYGEGHLLIFNKRHVVDFLELTERELQEIHGLIKIAVKIVQGMGYGEYAILAKGGEPSTRSVSHVHIHVLPKVLLKTMIPESRQILSEREIQNYVKKMMDALNDLEKSRNVL